MKENKMSNYTLLRGWLIEDKNGSLMRKGKKMVRLQKVSEYVEGILVLIAGH